MAQTSNQQSDLDSKCAKARPWVRRFVEEYQDGRPWGYAIFEDPTVDDEQLEECMSRIDAMLWSAKDATFGRTHAEFPPFKWEVLDWPEGSDGGDSGKCGDADAATRESEREPELGIGGESAHGHIEDGAGAEDAANDNADSGQDEADARQNSDDDDESDDDADIETVKELNKLRAHFKWVRDRAKKRRKAHETLDVDRSGIPDGLLRNVFLVIDQDVIDTIVVKSPMADNAWIWAIDPDYMGDVASMTKNRLKDEYYGCMRVRVQQLVNNFWDARHYHEDELPLPTLWAAARQSHNCAFVSVDPAEARMVHGGAHVGSALRVRPA